MKKTFKVESNRLSELLEDSGVEVIDFNRVTGEITIEFETEQDVQDFETYYLEIEPVNVEIFKSHTRAELKVAFQDGLTIYSLVIDGEIDDLLIADPGEEYASVVQDVLNYYEVDELPENMEVVEYRGKL